MKIKNKIKFRDAYSSEIRILMFTIYNIAVSIGMTVVNKKYHIFTNTFFIKVIVILIFDAISVSIIYFILRTIAIYKTKNINRKMPPTIEEIKKLGITSVEEYFAFLRKNIKIPAFNDLPLSDVNDKILLSLEHYKLFVYTTNDILHMASNKNFFDIFEDDYKNTKEYLRHIENLKDILKNTSKTKLTFTHKYKPSNAGNTFFKNRLDGVTIIVHDGNRIEIVIDIENCK